jgi:probable HAF family extracellular repeat protein
VTGQYKNRLGDHYMKALAAAFSALLVTTVAHSAPQYSLTEISMDFYRESFDWSGINDNGDVVGTWVHEIEGSRAVYLQHSTGALVWLPPLVASFETLDTTAAVMNNYGKIVGSAATPQCCGPVPVAWYTNGGMEEIGPYPNGTALTATGVANTGQAVGVGLINDVGGAQRAVLYRWANHSMTNLGQLGGKLSAATAISGHGSFITGWSRLASGDDHAFIFQNGPMKDLGTLGGKTSQGTGVNESGEVVGYSITASGAQHAFVYRQAKLVDLGNLAPRPDWPVRANGINDLGEIVGDATADVGGFPYSRAFLYTEGQMYNLTFLVARSDPSFGYVKLQSARAINCNGWILAFGYDTRDDPIFWGRTYLLTRQGAARAECPQPH